MRISTRVYMLAGMSFIAVIVIALLVFLSTQRHLKDHVDYDASRPLVVDIYQLNNLTQNYMIRPRERVSRQWLKVYERLTQNHIPAISSHIEEQKLIKEELLEEMKGVRQSFDEMINNNTSDTSRSQASRVYREHVTENIQLRLNRLIQKIISYWNTTSQHMTQDVTEKLTIFLVIIATVTFLLLAFTIYFSRSIYSRLSGFTGRLSSVSEQIAVTSEEHLRVLEQQLTAVNQTTSTMDELDASAVQTTNQADAASKTAGGVLKDTEYSKTEIDNLTGSVRMLRQKMTAIAEQIQLLTEQSGQIQGVVETVADIAGQTNMLALNAAVEASRAGEHGKGFAVVSQEIRKLAYQSKDEATRIRNLIQEIQTVTNSTVMAADEGGQALDAVSKQFENSGNAFMNMTSSVDGIVQSFQLITLNAKQQANAISQVVDAMNSISKGSEQANAGVSQTKSAIDDIVEMTRELNRMI